MKPRIALFSVLAGLAWSNSGLPQNQLPSTNDGVYQTAIGIRGGLTSGLTIKHFYSERHAFDGILGIKHDDPCIVVLVEKYASAYNVRGLNWYYGAGGHVILATEQQVHFRSNDAYYNKGDGLGLGLDGIVGIEYKIPSIPIGLSLDLKPFLEVYTGGGIWVAFDPGLGIKAAF